MRRLFVVIPAILVVLSLTTSVALAQDPTAGQTTWEKQVWQCQRCHGPMGEGLYARPLANSTLTADEWITQVRTPRRFMPSFSEAQVSDQQIRDIHAYITALPDPTGDFQRKDPGIATSHPGQELMIQKNCVACHEDAVATGTGSPIDGFIERGVTPTADVVIKQLRTPFKNMPSFNVDQVSDEEAGQIADYLAGVVANQQQAAPNTLPQSGDDTPANLPLLVLLAGSGLVLIGFTLRRLIKN
ncbi:MAG: cytochrome c [Chloroflexi bacterium]|nr:cytochrome c [Chloroflexota bacterium]